MTEMDERINAADRIPHRYPFLMLDRILEIDPGKSARAVKCVSVNEPWSTGHFQDHPVFPGVLMIETMAQTAALVFDVSGEEPAPKKEYYLASVEYVKFHMPAYPGDRLITEAKTVYIFENLSKVECVITREDDIIAKGTLILCVK